MPKPDAAVLDHLHDAPELVHHGRHPAGAAVFDFVDHHDDAEHRQLGLDDQLHDDVALFVRHAVQHHIEHDHDAVGKHFLVDHNDGAFEVNSYPSDRSAQDGSPTGLDFAKAG